MPEGLDIGAMSGRVELEDNLTGKLDIAIRKIEEFDERFGGMGKRVIENAASFFTAEAALHAMERGFEMLTDTAKEFFNVVLEGAGVADVEENFNKLAEGAGRVGETMMGVLREGTHNTIADFELMKSLNAALAVGVNITDQQYRSLATGAFALAQAKGMDVANAFELINDAMVRGQARGLRALDIRVNQTQAEEDFAKKLNTTAELLTDQEKIEATRAAILNSVTEATKRLGEQTDGLDERVAQASVAWKNFQEDLGKTVATSPVIMAGLDGIRDALTSAFGGKQVDIVKAVTSVVEDLAIKTLSMAEVVVDSVGVIGVTWNGALVVFENVKAGWAAIAYIAEGALLAIEKGLNKISFGALDESVAAIQADMEGWYNTMAESAAAIENHKSAEEGWAVTTGNVKDGIEKIRQRMIEAKQTQTESAGEVKKHAEAQGALAEATEKASGGVRMSKEEWKKYQDALKEVTLAEQSHGDVLNTIDGNVVEAVKHYLDLGVSIDKLNALYDLNAMQGARIVEIKKQEADALKAEADAAADLAKRWTEFYAQKESLTATDAQKATIAAEKDYEIAVQNLQAKGVKNVEYYNELWALRGKDIENAEQARIASDSRSKANLEQRLAQEKATLDMMKSAYGQFTDMDREAQAQVVENLKNQREHWNEVGNSIDGAAGKTKTMAGEVVLLSGRVAKLDDILKGFVTGWFDVNGKEITSQISDRYSEQEIVAIAAKLGTTGSAIRDMLSHIGQGSLQDILKAGEAAKAGGQKALDLWHAMGGSDLGGKALARTTETGPIGEMPMPPIMIRPTTGGGVGRAPSGGAVGGPQRRESENYWPWDSPEAMMGGSRNANRETSVRIEPGAFVFQYPIMNDPKAAGEIVRMISKQLVERFSAIGIRMPGLA